MKPFVAFSGAGNDFVLLDGRGEEYAPLLEAAEVQRVCREWKTDGLMILDLPRVAGTDFRMLFFNPDGSGGMMCGNGGRCIAAYADKLGIAACAQQNGLPVYRFEAPDGVHEAAVLSRPCPDCPAWTVRLGMKDVTSVERLQEGFFLDTGTRHLVVFVHDVDKVDVAVRGQELRHLPRFAPIGTNVDFVSFHEDGLHVRTFEKGVEGETLACGTGITASAIAAFEYGIPPESCKSIVPPDCGMLDGPERVGYELIARRGDRLKVEFDVHAEEALARNVTLTGPAEEIARP